LGEYHQVSMKTRYCNVPLPRINASRKDDITIYIEHELVETRNMHRIIGGWPGKEKTHELVKKADGLFTLL